MRFRHRAGHEAIGRKEAPERPRVPHCDGAALHAPGECEFCDGHPDWQQLREVWGINYTGHHDPQKAPCPVHASAQRRRARRLAAQLALSPQLIHSSIPSGTAVRRHITETSPTRL